MCPIGRSAERFNLKREFVSGEVADSVTVEPECDAEVRPRRCARSSSSSRRVEPLRVSSVLREVITVEHCEGAVVLEH